jgi:hypothetical protein
MTIERYKVDLHYKTRWSTASITGTIECYLGPSMPGPVKLVLTKEEQGMLQFKITLPGPSAVDVVTQELSVKIGDGDAVVQQVLADQTEVDGFEGADNAAAAVSLIQIDDAGNRSVPREQTFTLTDTLAPPVPGEIGLVVTGET